jgi:predicted RND superfamily exporter protein
MDTLDQNIELDGNKLNVTNSIKENLITSAKWARFLAIVGFIFTGFLGIASLVILISALMTGFAPLIGMGLVYVVLTVVMLFPGLYLIRFAGSIEKGLNTNKQSEFDFGIQNLKSLFKFMGIYTIVVIGIYILFFLIAAMTGMGRLF